MAEDGKRIRVPELKARKSRGEKIAMLTAYDATMARLMDCAGVDILLVGDSLGTVIMGYDSTVPVTMDEMVHHTRAVARGARRALGVADMPFLSYQVSTEEAVRSAGRLLQEGGAAAVKLEGGAPVTDVVRRLSSIGIPVMGHLGLQPQSVHQMGGYRRQATEPENAARLMDDAAALEAAGAFAVVLECIPAELAARVTEALRIPTIGIGAGPHCDGQVLVSYDAFGIFEDTPPFAKRYAEIGAEIVRATEAYVGEVRGSR